MGKDVTDGMKWLLRQMPKIEPITLPDIKPITLPDHVTNSAKWTHKRLVEYIIRKCLWSVTFTLRGWSCD